jgi:hypothetical protein
MAMPKCLTKKEKEFIVEKLLDEKVDEDTEAAVMIVMEMEVCPVIAPAPEPPALPPPGERAYKTPRHKFMSECLRGEKKDGCGKPMKECADLWKQGYREKPC